MKISSVNYNSLAPKKTKQDPHEEAISLIVNVIQNGNSIPELFDFNTKKNKLKKFKVFESIVLGIEKKKPMCVGVDPDVQELEHVQDRQYKLSISKRKEDELDFPYFVEVPGRFINLDSYPLRPIWLSVGSLKTAFGDKQLGFEVSLGERLKLGREEYRVNEIRRWLSEDKKNVIMHSTFFKNSLGEYSVFLI
jgi:hypothetical protein